MLSTIPQTKDAMVKAIMEPIKTLREPYNSLSLPLTGSITTNPSEYAVMVHPAQPIEVCRPLCREGKAVATIVESIDIISKANATMAKTNPR